MPLRFALRLFKHSTLLIYRIVTFAVLAVGVLFAVLVLLLRYWLLPNIDQYREEITYGLSRAANQRVQVGRIEGEWDGFRPRLILRDLALLDREGHVRVRLETVDGTLAWLSLLVGQLQFRSIELQELSLEIRRDASGNLFVAGIPVRQSAIPGEGGLGDWLLRQHRIVLRKSQLLWSDDRLGGEPLQLDDVEIRVEQSFGTHRFALRATPPMHVASPIDIRGEMRGRSFDAPASWAGQLYLGIAYADLAALRQWIELPMQPTRGSGALQIWSVWKAGRPVEMMADVSLSGVLTRLEQRLPELQLSRLHGRLGWRSSADKQEIWARALSFDTPDGVRLPPADISYSRTTAGPNRRATSELAFDALELEAVVRLIDRLPIDSTLRARLAELNPRGALRGFHISWQEQFNLNGPYSVRGGFRDVAWHPSGYLPGISNVTGTLDASEKGGSMSGKASATALSMPTVFASPLPLTTAETKVSWVIAGGLPTITIERLTLANPHVAGQITGRYQAVSGGPGIVDFKGAFPQGAGQEVWRYVPLMVDDEVRDWLRKSILYATARNIQVTLQGDLRKFPFSNPATGRFEALAVIENGTAVFAPGWHGINGVKANIAFRGNRMEIIGHEARVLGATLSGVTVVIPDLSAAQPVIQARGEAEGPTGEFVRYVHDSPLREQMGGFTERMRVNGRGHLALKVELPLNQASDIRLSGLYTFANNSLDPGGGLPVLEQFAGRLAFTQDGMNLPDASAHVYGAPARLSVATDAARSIRIQASGQVDAEMLRREVKQPWLSHLAGTTDWRLTAAVREQHYDFILESSLQGLRSSLPAPFAKLPQERIPLRIQRAEQSRGQDLVSIVYGSVLSGQLVLNKGGKPRVSRGEIVLGDKAPSPQRDGVWISGVLERVDLEQWQELWNEESKGDSSTSSLAGMNLSMRRMRVFSRDFQELRVDATRQKGEWLAKVNSRQFAGELRWLPEGQGVVVGRFSRLELPSPTPEIEPPGGRRSEGKDLPSVDLIADDFRMGTRQFGQLVLAAVPNGPDWRIERLELTNPDGALKVSGLWQAWAVNPRSQVDVKLEVTDIGRFLARMDLPRGVNGGKAKLEGKLSWAGPPYALDLPTLSGRLLLSASKGRFVKIDPGIGKLLSVVSLQMLPKVVTLDFRDIFSEGFAFDKIGGNVDITAGVARTQDFEMSGPAARVEMKGQVNLAAETQELDVQIFPALSESVALGTALVNPIIGLGALVVQKALRDPLSHILSFRYHIAGTWTAPKVTKKLRPPTDTGPPGRK